MLTFRGCLMLNNINITCMPHRFLRFRDQSLCNCNLRQYIECLWQIIWKKQLRAKETKKQVKGEPSEETCKMQINRAEENHCEKAKPFPQWRKQQVYFLGLFSDPASFSYFKISPCWPTLILLIFIPYIWLKMLQDIQSYIKENYQMARIPFVIIRKAI